MESPPIEKKRKSSQSVEALFSLLDLLSTEPALLLDATTILHRNIRFCEMFPGSLMIEHKKFQALVIQVLQTGLPSNANFLMHAREQQEIICVVTFTPLSGGKEIVAAMFRNICDIDSHTFNNVLKEEPFQSRCALPQIPFGISELNERATSTTWIYLSPAAKELLCAPGRPGLTIILQDKAKQWWIPEMLLLDRIGGFIHRSDGIVRFPELQVASISLKRIANGPTGLRRFFWLAEEKSETSTAQVSFTYLSLFVCLSVCL